LWVFNYLVPISVRDTMKTGAIVAIVIIVIAIIAIGVYFTVGTTHQKASSTTTSIVTSSVNITTTTKSNATTTTGVNSTTVNSTTTIKNTSKNYTILVEDNATYGNVIANDSGRVLYLYKADTPNSGKSNCYGGCAQVWPIFYTANITAAPGINASAFNTITRTDGTKQTTYMGWPLYFYVGDKNPGEVSGQGIQNFYVVTVPNLTNV
jgi:predicted lipoprotein with Yx(FWY)xxD motif